MKVIQIVVFFAGMVAAAWLAGYASSRVFMQIATKDARGTYAVDSLGAAAAAIAYLIVFALLVTLLVKVVYAGRPVDRIFVILAGYLGACLGAGFVLTLGWWVAGVLSPQSRSPVMPLMVIFPGSLLASGYIAVFALLPTLCVMAFTEFMKVRSTMFYGLAGATAAILAYCLYTAVFFREVSLSVVLGGLVFVAVPGLAGGLIYWWIAGRSAGGVGMRLGGARN